MQAMRIGIAGGGIGGLSAAIALRQSGHTVVVFEQAQRFLRVGSDINLTPNAAHAAAGLGLMAELRKWGAQPTHRLSRTWDSGEITSRIEMAGAAEARFGAPQLTLHRADLLRSLEEALPPEVLRLGCRLESVAGAGPVELRFQGGAVETVDALVGADGIHSVVRAHLHGVDQPRFTGMVCFRTVVPRERVASIPGIDTFTKWWGPDLQTQLVHFPISAGREIFVFATTGQSSWREEAWSMPGDIAEVRALYAGFHQDARALLAACDSVLKQALYDRDPLPFWSRGAITLLGDAAHAMLPYMAQGACMAVEDAVVLSRCLAGTPAADLAAALQRYEQARLERTSRVQRISRENSWLRSGNDGDWLYGYDAWKAPLS